jgi:carboxyl-terminal processing protease
MIEKLARASMMAAALSLAGCGGGGGGSGDGGSTTPLPTPVGSSGGGGATPTDPCSLVNRKAFAKGVIDEWYLFPETIPAALDPAPFATVQDYIDGLTATARAQRRDRFFTFITSIAQENAFNSTGSSAGFGFRISTDSAARRVFVTESFENTAALAAGIDRGDEITAIGTSAATLRTVTDIIAAEGSAGVTSALGPTTAGVTRSLRVTGPSGTRTLDVTKTDYNLLPVSTRYGARIIDDGGRRIGYLNLRTFISSANDPLRTAFGQWRAAGITEFVIDFRYNGGGLVSTADLIGDLMGGNRFTSEVFSQTTYRPEKSANNSVKRFAPTSNSVSPVRIAFIGTPATASASELVINSFIPYYGSRLALIGTNTFGKPVGQIAVDRSACDDRMRVVAFSTRNSANSDAYFDGLKTAVTVTCAATDDFTKPFGDASEASIRAALDFVAGRPCAPIADAGQGAQSLRTPTSRQELLIPDAPTPAQREVPGLF